MDWSAILSRWLTDPVYCMVLGTMAYLRSHHRVWYPDAFQRRQALADVEFR